MHQPASNLPTGQQQQDEQSTTESAGVAQGATHTSEERLGKLEEMLGALIASQSGAAGAGQRGVSFERTPNAAAERAAVQGNRAGAGSPPAAPQRRPQPQPRRSGSPRCDTARNIAEDEGDESAGAAAGVAESVWEELPVGDEPQESGGRDAMFGAISSSQHGELFAGHPLPLPNIEGPFHRPPTFANRTNHYRPSAAGDSLHGEIYSAIGAAGKRELCTLVPACSYQFDTVVYAAEIGEKLRRMRESGDTHVPISEVLEIIGAIGTQVESTLSHQKERLDELEAFALGGTGRAATFDPLYGNERSLSGARSGLGQALHASLDARRHGEWH